MSEVDQIVQACGDQPVCLYDGASIANPTELQGVLPSGVRVIVIPQPDAAQSIPTNTIASGVRKATGDDTVIVIEDRATDRFVVDSGQDADAITASLYSQGQADGGMAVAAVASTLDRGQPSNAADDGSSAGGILFGIIGVVVLAGAAAGFVAGVLRRKRNRTEGRRISARRLDKELSEALDGEDGEFVQDSIKRLGDRATALPDLGPLLAGLQGHVAELFVRVRRRGTDQQIRLLQSQYKDTLGKLLKALDDDYYGDVRANPQYWSNPDARLTEVQRAVGSVDRQAVENIRQVNESRDLEFQVALDSLIKNVDEAKLSDVYNDRDTN
ncbi:hypothetical protein GCM10010401_16720 [Rarobacter faecitabidus]|uniref:Uncharacterized protein n=1 Tax=Rarobacter faecitabidus TaxID=13243 RepID=A0A542ZX53_RARFA|nr:hypothetical protein [Rarobacter faecitabidus]TQL64925.1 hypothetical protein FB461_1457 [Rarobacter faecitabidus]